MGRIAPPPAVHNSPQPLGNLLPEPLITLTEIEKIANLAALELTVREKEQMVRQFEDILGYFKMIDAVKLPAAQDHPVDGEDHMRDDVTVKSDVSPDSFSSHLESGHFKVPKVIE